MVKNLPAMWEGQVRFLGWEDPPEKGMATHFRILAWRIPWTEEPGGLQSLGSQSAGVQPRWIQGIQSGDSTGEGKNIYLLI